MKKQWKTERHYLHGDQAEHDSDKYYCRSCDFFFDRSHFAEHDHPPGQSLANNQEKYQQSLKTWKSLKASIAYTQVGKAYKKVFPNPYRPNNAINLFE